MVHSWVLRLSKIPSLQRKACKKHTRKKKWKTLQTQSKQMNLVLLVKCIIVVNWLAFNGCQLAICAVINLIKKIASNMSPRTIVLVLTMEYKLQIIPPNHSIRNLLTVNKNRTAPSMLKRQQISQIIPVHKSKRFHNLKIRQRQCHTLLSLNHKNPHNSKRTQQLDYYIVYQKYEFKESLI